MAGISNTFYVKIIRRTPTHLFYSCQSAIAVTIVFGIAPASRPVVVFQRPPLVQETLTVFLIEPVQRIIRLYMAHFHRNPCGLIVFAEKLVAARYVGEIFGRMNHYLKAKTR